MKLKAVVMFVAAMSVIEPCAAETWVSLSGNVSSVGSGWDNNIACVLLDTGDMIKLDLTNEMGRAELSLAISAKLAGKPLKTRVDNDSVLTGGCNSGINIKDHATLTIID